HKCLLDPGYGLAPRHWNSLGADPALGRSSAKAGSVDERALRPRERPGMEKTHPLLRLPGCDHRPPRRARAEPPCGHPARPRAGGLWPLLVAGRLSFG
ncbi:hypothetical protein NGA_2045500, partial [Nannochloropsis gaditana CCMP526]|uniref:uncharacterized protein n=1 Tax=Nannochloropsis gaditana (strain CCMP526) TaxID=1093141 RepID=UPI00029F7B66